MVASRNPIGLWSLIFFFQKCCWLCLAGKAVLLICCSLDHLQILQVKLCMCCFPFFWYCNQFSDQLYAAVNSSPVQLMVSIRALWWTLSCTVLFHASYWLVIRFLLTLQIKSILLTYSLWRSCMKYSLKEKTKDINSSGFAVWDCFSSLVPTFSAVSRCVLRVLRKGQQITYFPWS